MLAMTVMFLIKPMTAHFISETVPTEPEKVPKTSFHVSVKLTGNSYFQKKLINLNLISIFRFSCPG